MQQASYARSVASQRGQRGSIEVLADGRVRARYRAAGRTGPRPQKTFATKREAQQWLRERLAESERVASGDQRPLTQQPPASCAVGIERFIATVDQAPSTARRMRGQLDVFGRSFGERPLGSLAPHEIEAWRLTISPGWRGDVFRETRRMFAAWQRWGWIETNPSDGIRNRRARRPEVDPISWADILLLEDEIDVRFAHVPVLASGTGLRPEEWLALERRDLDLAERVIHVRRVWSSGRLVELGADGAKTYRQRRRVPLRETVVERLQATVPRLDTPLLVPAAGGQHLGLGAFRERVWLPAFAAADLEYQKPYAMRHTYAAESIAAGVNLFDLSRFMGTSLQEIDRTYGHLVSDSEQRGRELLDAYDRARGAARRTERRR